MITKRVTLIVTGMAAAIFFSVPVFAAKVLLSDAVLNEVTGNANRYSVNGNLDSTASIGDGAKTNIQITAYQWSDDHANDRSQDKGANDQSGATSQVQQHIGGQANALVVGAVSQNVLMNGGESVGGDQIVTAYAAVSEGGF